MKITLTNGKTQYPVPDKPEVTIGRFKACDIVLPIELDRISRKHCILIQKDGKISIKDAGSTNGTIVNDKPVIGDEQAFLSNGDKIELPGYKLTVQIGDKIVTPKAEDPNNKSGSSIGLADSKTPILKPADEDEFSIPEDLVAEVQKSVGAKPQTQQKPVSPAPVTPKPVAAQPKPAAAQTQVKQEPAKWNPPQKTETTKTLIAQAQAQGKKPEKKGFLGGLFSKKEDKSKKPVVKKK